jgi:hypothetical protein
MGGCPSGSLFGFAATSHRFMRDLPRGERITEPAGGSRFPRAADFFGNIGSADATMAGIQPLRGTNLSSSRKDLP